MSRPVRFALLAAALWLVAGCDQLGIESAQMLAERREADGRAIGGACRHAARALEDCFALNRKADKAAIFEGWREMNDYMREHSIEAVVPQLGAGVAAAQPPAASSPDHQPRSSAARPTAEAPAAAGRPGAADDGAS